MIGKLLQWRKDRYLQKLKARGLKLGADVFLNDGFFLDPSHCALITIQDRVVFGPSVTVLAHDASTKKIIGKTRVKPVVLGENCFIGARAVILPGVTVGRNSIVGAGAVVATSIPENEVWGGVPARFICGIEELRERLNREGLPTISYGEFAAGGEKEVEFNREVLRAGGGWVEG